MIRSQKRKSKKKVLRKNGRKFIRCIKKETGNSLSMRELGGWGMAQSFLPLLLALRRKQSNA
jgi:hypothetical protein